MKKTIFICFLLGFQILIHHSTAQHVNIDSLKTLLKTANEDKNKVNILNKIAHYYKEINYELAKHNANLALTLSKKLTYQNGKAEAYLLKGHINEKQSNYIIAMDNALMALKIWEKENDSIGISKAYLVVGRIHSDQNSHNKALEYYEKSLKLNEVLKDIKGMILSYRLIGSIYHIKSQVDKEEGALDKALNYFHNAHNLIVKIGDYNEKAISFNNIGVCYGEKGDYKKSLEYFFRSLEMHKKTKNNTGIALSYRNIGDCYIQLKEYEKALNVLNKAEEIALNLNAKAALSAAYYYKITVYEIQGKYKKASSLYKKYLKLRGEIINEKNQKEISRLQTKYETEKKDQQIKIQNQQLQLQDAKIKRKNIVVLAVSGGIALSFSLIGILFNRFKLKQKAFLLIQKQKEEITIQRDLLEESHDNIKYLNNIGKKITSSLSAETIIDTTYEYVNKLLDASVFCIGVYNKSTEKIEFRGAIEKGEKLKDFEYDVNDYQHYLSALCFQKQEEIIIQSFSVEYSKYIEDLPKSDETLPESVIYVPLITSSKKLLGVMSVQSYARSAYSENHFNIIRNLANYSAIAIENAKSHEEAIQKSEEITRQKDKINHLFRELNHRVKNNFQLVISLLNMQSRELDNEMAKIAIVEINERLHAMSILHEDLYLDDDINTLIDVKTYFIHLASRLSEAHGFQNKVKFHFEINDLHWEADTVIPLGLIVNEVLMNAFKHAFKEVKYPEIRIILKESTNKSYYLLLGDNGNGIQENKTKDNLKSFGMKMVFLFASDQLNGKLQKNSSKHGTNYELTFIPV